MDGASLDSIEREILFLTQSSEKHQKGAATLTFEVWWGFVLVFVIVVRFWGVFCCCF